MIEVVKSQVVHKYQVSVFNRFVEIILCKARFKLLHILLSYVPRSVNRFTIRLYPMRSRYPNYHNITWLLYPSVHLISLRNQVSVVGPPHSLFFHHVESEVFFDVLVELFVLCGITGPPFGLAWSVVDVDSSEVSVLSVPACPAIGDFEVELGKADSRYMLTYVRKQVIIRLP